MSAERILGPAVVLERLSEMDILPARANAQATELGWGVSNTVFKVTWPGDCVIVKQALPKLRVAADWPFDPERARIERDCLLLLARIVPGCTPTVRGFDEQASLLVVSCVPAGGVLWKQALLEGVVDLAAAARAGALLGRIHTLAADDHDARERFFDDRVLVQGRTDPFHITAAAAHPRLAPAIEAEVERLRAKKVTLTLGDYSPKNLFVYPRAVVAIDFETAHWGDPAFDVAFCLTHIMLKAFRQPAEADVYLAAAARFWVAYRRDGHPACAESAVARELGCLLLARIDGKSPVEYLEDQLVRERVRALAAVLIETSRDSVAEAIAVAAEHLVLLRTRSRSIASSHAGHR